MFDHKKIILVFAFVVLIFGILFFLLKGNEEKYFNPVNLEIRNDLINSTNKKYLDTIIHVGLKNLGIENTFVVINTLTPDMKASFGDDSRLYAHIRKTPYQYLIWIDDLTRETYINVLSHELIHLEQYETKNLSYENGCVIWLNEKYDLSNLSYDNRPWEIDAFTREKDLKKLIIDELYGN